MSINVKAKPEKFEKECKDCKNLQFIIKTVLNGRFTGYDQNAICQKRLPWSVLARAN
jgi:hypothetical protein